MTLNNEREVWLTRCRDAEYIAGSMEKQLPPNTQVVLPRQIKTIKEVLQMNLGWTGDELPVNDRIASAVTPFVNARDRILSLEDSSSGWDDIRSKFAALAESARIVGDRLDQDLELREQTVEEVVEDLSRYFRLSMFLCLTANRQLSDCVEKWIEQKELGNKTGDYLDFSTFEFVENPSKLTISMPDLSANSIGQPTILHPGNMAATLNAMMNGEEKSPEMYRLAYGQWFTSMHAAWDEVYRQRLAKAHNRSGYRKDWRGNDITCEFFDAIRHIRNDFVHNEGVCKKSKGVTIIGLLTEGDPISPSPLQMMRLLDMFPKEELLKEPTEKREVNAVQLPYRFDPDWVSQVKEHISNKFPSKNSRANGLKEAIDDWMKSSS